MEESDKNDEITTCVCGETFEDNATSCRKCGATRSVGVHAVNDDFLQGFLKPHLSFLANDTELAHARSSSVPLLRASSVKSNVQGTEVEMEDFKGKTEAGSASPHMGATNSDESFMSSEASEPLEFEVVRRSSFNSLGSRRITWQDYGFGGKSSAIACGFIFLLVVTGLAVLQVLQKKFGTSNASPSEEAQMEQELKKTGPENLGFLSQVVKKWQLAGNEQVGRLFGAGFNARGDLNALSTSIMVAIILGSFALLLHAFLRRRFPFIYDGRLNEIKGIAERLYSTVRGRVDDEEADRIIQGAGLDCWMLLQFHTLCCRFTFLIGSVLVVTLLPIHFCQGTNDTGVLSRFSVNNIRKERGHLFYIHAILVNYVVILGAELIVRAHRRFLLFRYAWLSALPRPRATTLMVEHLPAPSDIRWKSGQSVRTDMGLKAYFQHLFGHDAIERAYVVRKTKELKNLVKDGEVIQDKLLFAEEKWIRAGRRTECRPKVLVGDQEHDMITAYENTLREKEALINEERMRIELAMRDEDESISASAGFVTFKSRSKAVLAVLMQYTEDSSEFELRFAPEPDDVIYDDLNMDPIKQRSKVMLGRLSLVGFFLSCAPAMFVVSKLVRIESMEKYCPPLYRFMRRHDAAKAVMQGVISTAILKGFVIVLPKILLKIIDKFYCLKAGSLAQVKLQKWYFAFQTIFLVLAMACGDSIISAAARLVEDPLHIFSLLDSTLPLSSHTYLNFVVMGCFLRIFELLRITTFIKYHFFRPFMSQDEATKRAQKDDPAFHGMGTRMVKTATTANMAIVFCMIDPLICLFSWVYFSIGRTTYKFLMVHSERKKADLGGVFWVEALNQTFFSLGLFCMLMVGVLGVRAPDFWPATIAACSSFVLIERIREMKRLAWTSLPYEKVVDLDKSDDTASRVTKGEYIQPEVGQDLTAKYPTPRRASSANIFGEVGFAAKSVQMAVKSMIASRRSSVAPMVCDGAMSQTGSTSSRRSIIVDTRRASVMASDPLLGLRTGLDPLMGRQASIGSEFSRKASVMFAVEDSEAVCPSSPLSPNELPFGRRKSQVAIIDTPSFYDESENLSPLPAIQTESPKRKKSILKRQTSTLSPYASHEESDWTPTDSLESPLTPLTPSKNFKASRSPTPEELKKRCLLKLIERSQDGSLRTIVEKIAQNERGRSFRMEELRERCYQKLIARSQDGSFNRIVEKLARNERGSVVSAKRMVHFGNS